MNQSDKKITFIDFSHRFGGEIHDALDIIEAADEAAFAAIGILKIFQQQYTGDNANPFDEAQYWALDSVIKNIKDMQASINAYHSHDKNDGQ